MKLKPGSLAEGCEMLRCPSCKRVGCFMVTDDKNYVQCKCGEEVQNPLADCIGCRKNCGFKIKENK